VFYTLIALIAAMLIAIPLGLLVGHTGRGVFLVVGLANGIRAVPAFGLLVMLYLDLSSKIGYKGQLSWLFPRGGFGSLVVVEIVLTALAIPAILTNTYAGV